MGKVDFKKQVAAAHRMGKAEGLVRGGYRLSEDMCLEYIGDVVISDMPPDPVVVQEMIAGDSKKVLKKLNKFIKKHGYKI